MQKIIVMFFISLFVSVALISVYHMYNTNMMHDKFNKIIEQLNTIENERRYCK